MITLINPPGIRNFSGLQPAQAPNPPLGMAYIAGALKARNHTYEIIDGPGLALENIVRFSHESFGKKDRFYLQGITPEDVVSRIPENTKVIGISCLFSLNWILTNRIAYLARKRFPSAILVLGVSLFFPHTEAPTFTYIDVSIGAIKASASASVDALAIALKWIPSSLEYIPR